MSGGKPGGLDQLDARRQAASRRARNVPPARHPKSQRVDVDTPVEAGKVEPVAQASRDDSRPASAGATTPGLRVTLYVDQESDAFMEAARIAGLVAKPKTDISRSAVVRLALRRLMSEMTADQVKEHLQHQVITSQGPGRKRR